GGQCARELGDGALGYRIDAAAGGRGEGVDRGDVDHGAVGALELVGKGHGDVEGAVDIDCHGAGPALAAVGRQHVAAQVDAGIVDQDADRPDQQGDVLGELAAALVVGD